MMDVGSSRNVLQYFIYKFIYMHESHRKSWQLLFFARTFLNRAEIAQSVQRLNTGRTVRGSNPG
jgi:hypothetical protein